jgi:hypothetical protein
MTVLSFLAGIAVGGLIVVFFARRNLNTLKRGSDTLHNVTDKVQEKIKKTVDK